MKHWSFILLALIAVYMVLVCLDTHLPVLPGLVALCVGHFLDIAHARRVRTRG